jgi:hypothetical protein
VVLSGEFHALIAQLQGVVFSTTFSLKSLAAIIVQFYSEVQLLDLAFPAMDKVVLAMANLASLLRSLRREAEALSVERFMQDFTRLRLPIREAVALLKAKFDRMAMRFHVWRASPTTSPLPMWDDDGAKDPIYARVEQEAIRAATVAEAAAQAVASLAAKSGSSNPSVAAKQLQRARLTQQLAALSAAASSKASAPSRSVAATKAAPAAVAAAPGVAGSTSAPSAPPAPDAATGEPKWCYYALQGKACERKTCKFKH